MIPCPTCGHPNRPGARFCSMCQALLGGAPSGARVQLQPGQWIKGNGYRIVRPLSKGGMGAIYLVEDAGAFGKWRVLKEMLDYIDRPEYKSQAEYDAAVRHAGERFVEEARILAALVHPGIPDIIEFFTEGGRNYIIMEYVEGDDLEKGLTRTDEQGFHVAGRALPAEIVIQYGIQVCRILEYLGSLTDPQTGHPRPVVHQDIKPANLILSRATGSVCLVDFGTAKARFFRQASGSVGLAKSSVYGTIGYAPPEQYSGQSAPKSDVYALGATLYHLATDDDPRGHPFDFPALPRLPAGLQQVLRAALQQQVDQRPLASQMRGMLEALVSKQGGGQVFTFSGGTMVRSPQEMAAACDQHWNDAKAHLYNGDFDRWFRELNRHDLVAESVRLRAQEPDQDAGLEQLIHRLDPSLPWPTIQATPPQIDFGSMTVGQDKSTGLSLLNPGRGFVVATLRPAESWHSASPDVVRLLGRGAAAVTATAKGASLPARTQALGTLVLQTNCGQTLSLAVQARLPVWKALWARWTPYSDWALMVGAVLAGILAGLGAMGGWLHGSGPWLLWLAVWALLGLGVWWLFTEGSEGIWPGVAGGAAIGGMIGLLGSWMGRAWVGALAGGAAGIAVGAILQATKKVPGWRTRGWPTVVALGGGAAVGLVFLAIWGVGEIRGLGTQPTRTPSPTQAGTAATAPVTLAAVSATPSASAMPETPTAAPTAVPTVPASPVTPPAATSTALVLPTRAPGPAPTNTPRPATRGPSATPRPPAATKTPTPVARCPNPGARITKPGMDEDLSGTIYLLGTANIPNFSYYKVEFRPDGVQTWGLLMRNTVPKNDDVLMHWVTSTVPVGVYWLQLVVVDSSGNYVDPCSIRVRVTR